MTDRLPIWRQPLLHFLAGGALIFALASWRGETAPPPRDHIVVSVSDVERLAALWGQTWGRPPSSTELRGLVGDHIREEIYYREALALGLDIDDQVIRRRLRQKLEAFGAEGVDAEEPDDAALAAFYEANKARYAPAAVYDFEQVFFRQGAPVDMAEIRAKLATGADPHALADPTSLPAALRQVDRRDVERVFGVRFFQSFEDLPEGEWAGPVESGFGSHLVRINRRLQPPAPAPTDIRERLVRDWREAERARRSDEFYEELRGRYVVEIERPESAE